MVGASVCSITQKCNNSSSVYFNSIRVGETYENNLRPRESIKMCLYDDKGDLITLDQFLDAIEYSDMSVDDERFSYGNNTLNGLRKCNSLYFVNMNNSGLCLPNPFTDTFYPKTMIDIALHFKKDTLKISKAELCLDLDKIYTLPTIKYKYHVNADKLVDYKENYFTTHILRDQTILMNVDHIGPICIEYDGVKKEVDILENRFYSSDHIPDNVSGCNLTFYTEPFINKGDLYLVYVKKTYVPSIYSSDTVKVSKGNHWNKNLKREIKKSKHRHLGLFLYRQYKKDQLSKDTLITWIQQYTDIRIPDVREPLN